MLKDIIAKIWRKMPRGLRWWTVRITQKKFTVSAGAVIVKDNKVLLLDHVLRPANGWGIPGGFIQRARAGG